MLSSIRHLLFLCFAIVSLNGVSAQNGLYDARIAVKTFDCANRSVILQVQIRATRINSRFKLGDANYRFTYDPRQIKQPVLVTQDNFSNQAPALDRNYGPQNLSGSAEGDTKAILSINCFYSGGAEGAKSVDTSWMTVSCVKFSVVDANNCIKINWNDSNTFPVTGMNEVIVTSVSPYEYTTANVQASENYINIDECFTQACVNKAPTVASVPIVVNEDSVSKICLRIVDSNFSDKHTVTICGDAINGVAFAAIDNNRHELCVEYTPDANFNGADSVCVLVCDNAAMPLCTTVKIPITVNPVADPPSVSVSTLTAQAGVQLDTCFTIMDNDKGDVFKANICGKSIGTVQTSVSGDKLCVRYKSSHYFSGQDSICVTICDASGICQSFKIVLNVTPCADAGSPVISCPANIEVSLGGVVLNDPNKFISNAVIGDNCNTVLLNFKNPTATDDCIVKSITQVSGTRSGEGFATGNNTLVFEAKDNAGKTSTCSVNVVVQPVQLLLVNTVSTCLNDVVSVTATPYPGAAYQWKGARFSVNSPVLTFPLVSPLQQGIYTINATLGKNCTYRDSLKVSLKEAPVTEHDSYIMPLNETLTGVVTQNDSIVLNRPYTVRVKDNVSSGKLLLDDKGTFTYQPVNGFLGVVGFTYEVCYTDCPNSCQISVASIKVANNKRTGERGTNIISPNGDGINDAFKIEGLDPTLPNNKSEITIFSQWGEKVYWASPYNNDWQGTFGGQPLPVGTYYFIFKKNPDALPITSFVSIVK